MSASTLIIRQQLTLPKKILLCCGVFPDGVGDFYHLVDLLKIKNTILPEFEKDVLVLYAASDEDKKRFFMKKLENMGFNVIRIPKATDFPRLVDNTSKPTAYLFEKLIGDNLELLKEKYAATIAISTRTGKLSEQMPSLSITEHTGHSGEYIPRGSTTVNMNFSEEEGAGAIFLTQENRADPDKQLHDILSKPINAAVCNALLGEEKITTEDCQRYLADNLFIPCYFQFKEQRFIDFLNLVQASPLSAKFKSTTFFVNRIDLDLLAAACQQGVIEKHIGKITIQTPSDTHELVNPFADKDNPEAVKAVKFAVGFRIEDDEDYNQLFHCAQVYAGASGDKTFEKIISNSLIPLFIPHNIDKEHFMEVAAEVFPLFARLPTYHFHRYAPYRNDAAQAILKSKDTGHPILKDPAAEAQKLDESFFSEWKKLCEILQTQYSLQQKLPAIINTILIPQLIIRELAALVSQPDMPDERMKAFLTKTGTENLKVIVEYCEKIFYQSHNNDHLNGQSLYRLLKATPAIKQAYPDFDIDSTTLAIHLLQRQLHPTIEDLMVAQQCLKEMVPNPNRPDLISRLTKSLHAAFKELGHEIPPDATPSRQEEQKDSVGIRQKNK